MAQKILITGLILAMLGVVCYAFFYKNRRKPPISRNFGVQAKTVKFQGVIKDMRMDCYMTGFCVISLEPNIIVSAGYNPGDVSPKIREAQEKIWGRLIGFEMGKKYIGSPVELFAEDKGASLDGKNHHYTLEGNENYYIKLLDGK